MNIADAVFDHARERPQHPALEDDGNVVTYAELAALIFRASAALRAREVGSGDIVVVALPNSVEHVVVLYALAMIEAISVSIDEAELERDTAVTLSGLFAKVAIVRDDTVDFPGLAVIPADALFRDPAQFESARSKSSPAPGDDRDLALTIAQSSGTTGEPKRLLVTHDQMIGVCHRLIGMLELTPLDRYLHITPLRYYSARRRCMTILTLGATMVLCKANSVFSACLQHISTRKITYVHFTATHLRTVLAEVPSDGPLWPNVKLIVGAAPITPEERRLARRRLTPCLYEIFATNEVGHLALASPTDQDRYAESVGRLAPGIEAQVVDDNGSPLPFGEIGKIGFRGRNFPRRYHGDLQATKRHFRDGWFYPDDLAALNQEGYIFLKGRADDVINQAGVKYYPAEVEAALLLYPSVRDVAVIGGPHGLLGEVSVAFIVSDSRLSVDEIQKFCKNRMAMHKAPHYIFFANELPRVGGGKTDKKKLRAVFRQYLETRAQ